MHRSELFNYIHKYIANAASRLERARYAQESAYVDAFLGRLDGVIHLEESGAQIDLKATVLADRGRGAAESKFGADFALVFSSKGGAVEVDKAVIAQAKNGNLEDISKAEQKRLSGQCEKMGYITKQYFVLEAPTMDGAIPSVRLGDHATRSWVAARMSFDEYLVDQVICCIHGDTRREFINAVNNSKLSTIKITATGVEYVADPQNEKRNF